MKYGHDIIWKGMIIMRLLIKKGFSVIIGTKERLYW